MDSHDDEETVRQVERGAENQSKRSRELDSYRRHFCVHDSDQESFCEHQAGQSSDSPLECSLEQAPKEQFLHEHDEAFQRNHGQEHVSGGLLRDMCQE